MSINKKKMLLILALAILLTMLFMAFSICSIWRRDFSLSSARLHAIVHKNRINYPLEFSTPSPSKILKLQQLELPNVPFEHWLRIRSKRLNKTCAYAPFVYELRFHNNYWQKFYNLNVTYHIFNAYLDVRAHVTQTSGVVRLLAMINQKSAPANVIYCQLWYNAVNKPVIVTVAEQRRISLNKWNTGDEYFSYLLSCVVPRRMRKLALRAVSLVTRLCDTATNLLRVHYERPADNESQTGFAVCVKGLDYPHTDIGPRLVEWLELQRLLGARKVITYKLAVHPNVDPVLQHYIAEGFVEVHPLSLGSDMVSAPLYLHGELDELVPYNDCFYRNMYKYAYIVVVDIDEVILPLGYLTNWQQLIDETRRQRTENCVDGYASVCVRKAIYSMDETVNKLPGVPPGGIVACFHNTSEVLTLYNSNNVKRSKNCFAFEVGSNLAHMQHYSLLKESTQAAVLTLEKSLYRYKEALMRNVAPVLRKLNYLD